SQVIIPCTSEVHGELLTPNELERSFSTGTDACDPSGVELSLHPPVYGRFADGWPRHIQGVGRVTGLLPGYCGMACNAATLRIELEQPIAGYPGQRVLSYGYCIFAGDASKFC